MLGSSWHWNSPRFYLRQENSPMNGALTTLKWMLMIIQLFTMAHLFLDGLPGLPIKFSSSPWAPKTWARIHLLWPVQVGSTHFFTWHRKISQCEFWKLLIQEKGAFHLHVCCKKIWLGNISMVKPGESSQRGPGGLNDKTSAGTANSLLRSASGNCEWKIISQWFNVTRKMVRNCPILLGNPMGLAPNKSRSLRGSPPYGQVREPGPGRRILLKGF